MIVWPGLGQSGYTTPLIIVQRPTQDSPGSIMSSDIDNAEYDWVWEIQAEAVNVSHPRQTVENSWEEAFRVFTQL